MSQRKVSVWNSWCNECSAPVISREWAMTESIRHPDSTIILQMPTAGLHSQRVEISNCKWWHCIIQASELNSLDKECLVGADEVEDNMP